MSDVSWRFYEMMHYPTPIRKEFFAFQTVDTSLVTTRVLPPLRSWLYPPSEQMQEYREEIARYQWLWSWIPCVQSVFLSNSITFNALQESSNIDFFVVTRSERLWTTKLYVSLVLWTINTITKKQWRRKRWVADFMITEDALDLKWLLLYPSDPYLVYRIAHLVPVYHSDFSIQDRFFEANKRLQYYLPNFQFRQSIFLNIEVCFWIHWIKRWWERLVYSYSLVWVIIEYAAYMFWKFSFMFWRRKHPQRAQHSIATTMMYKMYDDKRKRFALKRELRKKNV